MRDVATELKDLHLNEMASAWEEFMAHGELAALQLSRWLVEHLQDVEHVDRNMRSIRNQLNSTKFPVHRDLARFDFEQFKVDRGLVAELADLSFNEAAHRQDRQSHQGDSGHLRHSA
jgi:hypothetical protein